MIGRLACRCHSVVTAGAIPEGICVVEIGRSPAGDRMTGLALIAGWQMVRRFALRRCPVMAAGALSLGLGVIEMDGRPA